MKNCSRSKAPQNGFCTHRLIFHTRNLIIPGQAD